MGKLSERVKSAGFNAGTNYYARIMKISDLVEDPEIAAVFKVHDITLKSVAASIKQNGFDSAEPVVTWKGRNVIVDGHTRVKAAKIAELTEVPVIEKEFEDIYAAILYTFERQANRRNLTQSEIYAVSNTLHNKTKEARDGSGRSVEMLASRLNVAASTIYRARKIHLSADEKDLKALQDGETTINQVYKKVKEKKRPARAKNSGDELLQAEAAEEAGDENGEQKIDFAEMISSMPAEVYVTIKERMTLVLTYLEDGAVNTAKDILKRFLGEKK